MVAKSVSEVVRLSVEARQTDDAQTLIQREDVAGRLFVGAVIIPLSVELDEREGDAPIVLVDPVARGIGIT